MEKDEGAAPGGETTGQLPNRLRELRKERGLTLKDLAEKVGTTFAHVARIERGERDITLIWMQRFAKALDVTPADLLSPDDGGLLDAERMLIDTYREVPEAMRASIAAVAEAQQPFRGAGEVIPLTPRKAG